MTTLEERLAQLKGVKKAVYQTFTPHKGWGIYPIEDFTDVYWGVVRDTFVFGYNADEKLSTYDGPYTCHIREKLGETETHTAMVVEGGSGVDYVFAILDLSKKRPVEDN